MFFGAGEGDVEQAQAFAQVFVVELFAVGFVELAVGKQFAAVFAVEDVSCFVFLFGSISGERAEDEGILQAFGGMDGYDFDQCLVAFQP